MKNLILVLCFVFINVTYSHTFFDQKGCQPTIKKDLTSGLTYESNVVRDNRFGEDEICFKFFSKKNRIQVGKFTNYPELGIVVKILNKYLIIKKNPLNQDKFLSAYELNYRVMERKRLIYLSTTFQKNGILDSLVLKTRHDLNGCEECETHYKLQEKIQLKQEKFSQATYNKIKTKKSVGIELKIEKNFFNVSIASKGDNQKHFKCSGKLKYKYSMTRDLYRLKNKSKLPCIIILKDGTTIDTNNEFIFFSKNGEFVFRVKISNLWREVRFPLPRSN